MASGAPRSARGRYMAKADDLLATACLGLETGSYSAAAITSMYAAISALNSLAAGKAGFGPADHAGALELAGGALGRRDHASLGRHIGRLLALRRLERGPDLATRRQASDAVRSARRVLAIVRPALGRSAAPPAFPA